MTENKLDAKTLQMVEIYERRSYRHVHMTQRLRLRMIFWVIRLKVLNSLKRLLDIAVASLMLLALSPLMGMTALLVKITSPGPIFFGQTRVGKYGTTFTCYKFRSMYIDAEARKKELMALNEADGPVFKMKNDPRVTSVGRIIRKLSIDELPQLWNVMKGEMSLVGPRPPVPQEVAEYQFDQLQRLHAVPGITGLQQVSGRSNMDFKRWVELDIQYISEQSLWNDIKILFKTIPAVLFSRGAY